MPFKRINRNQQILDDRSIVSIELTSQTFNADNLSESLTNPEHRNTSTMAFWSRDEYGTGTNTKLVLITTLLIFLGTLFALLAVIYSGKVHTNVNTLINDVEELKSKINTGPGSDDDIVTPPPSTERCSSAVNEDDQFDCHPENEATEERCQKRGCCWNNQGARNNISCHFPTGYQGFKVASIRESDDKKKITVNLNRYTPSGFPKEVTRILVEVMNLDETKLRIRITDPTRQRFEPQLPVLNVHRNPYEFSPEYQVEVNGDGVLTVKRKTNGRLLLNIDLRHVIFTDQYLQLSSPLPSNEMYGLGEHFEDYKITMKEMKRFTFMNGDRPPEAKKPLYGSHPFFYQVEDDKHESSESFGVLLFNNNPKDIMLYPKPSITYRVTGGVFDFFVYLGSDPQHVLDQHMELIGKPELPPFWSLGWHLCKWGWGSLNRTVEIHKKNKEAGIPFDVQWNDIDYMNHFEDFTYAKDNFSGLPDFVRKIQEEGMHYVPIIDPAIEGGDMNYAPYEEAKELDIFVKNADDTIFEGHVWNTNVSYFPDFTHPKTADWWVRQLRRFHDEVPYDGLWIDMNEPANFYNGEGKAPGKCPKNDLEQPPYIVGDGSEGLVRKTVCMSAKHHIGPHADVHNMYALYEAKMTKEALLAIRNKRQFIISRATVTGQGQYGMHWTGDVWSDWESMRQTISSIFQSSMNGMPYVGSDICGFMGNTTIPLCTRWSALGAFYPFSRNHNHETSIDQDPATLGGDVLEATKKNNLIRYSLLPYFYTLFYEAARSGQSPFRPLTLNFPKDAKSFEYVNDQFMWGNGILFIPVLTEGATSVKGYFPPGKWYHLDNKTVASDGNGQEVMLSIPMVDIGIYVRGGSIIARQEPKLTTTAQRKESKIELLVALDSKEEATGQLFWDDGDSFDTIKSGRYNLIEFKTNGNKLTTNPKMLEYPDEAGIFDCQLMEVVGVLNEVSSVKVGDTEIPKDSWDYKKENQLLTIRTSVDLTKKNVISWQ